MVVQVIVHGPKMEKKTIDLCDTEEQLKSITVLQLKEKILSVFSVDSDFRLVYRHEALDDDSALLSEYGLEHLSAIHTIMKLPGGGYDPGKGDGGMGDKDKNRSMEKLSLF